MNDAPWLNPKTIRIVNLLLSSHERAFGKKLIKYQTLQNSQRLHSQELFSIDMPVMAHDTSNDPCLNYANAAALKLWCRNWNEMIGMPSRLTAPINERRQRKDVLSQALNQDAVKGYQGIRIDRKGRKFLISNARIWTIWDEKGLFFGQAATFSNWWHIK